MTLAKLPCLKFVSSLLFAFVAMLPAHLIAQNYTYTNIDYPGANTTSPTAVNDSGSVVGTYLDSNGNTHGFLYSGGVYTTIDDPEGTTFPQGINNSGEITGSIAVSVSEDYGFTYVDGVFTTFSYPGGNGQTGGQGINNHNEIVGIYTTGGTVGFLDINGSFSTFNYPGAEDTFPHAISDSGAIAGFYTASTVPFGFVYEGSTFTSLSYPGSYATFAFGINNAGVVVGYASLNDYPTYEVGFLWQAGQFTVINSTAFPQPAGINNNGQIVGVYFPGGNYHGFIATPTTAPPPLQFYPALPCRVVDTRNPNGQFGGPPISGGSSRSFPITQGGCSIGPNAAAYSLNVTLVPINHHPVSYLTIWPTGQSQPVVSTMNSLDGRVKANAAIVPGGTGTAVSVYVTDTTNVVIDIDGYFETPTSQTYAFHSLTPCRVADTRKSNFPQGLGTPHLSAGVARDFPVLNSSCISAGDNAIAYSLNLTAIPYPALGDQLGYLEIWPTGYQPPNPVSTLNNPTGTYVANAAIVAVPPSGSITAYASSDTDLAIDINGYFSLDQTGGLSLYPTAPCRVIDTRKIGTGQPFSGALNPPVDVVTSPCNIPATAQAYVFNATVVPSPDLSYLTLWPDGQGQPIVSTLNAADGWITSNMAIVPNGDGKIDAYASGVTQLILDISSYFAP